MDATIIWMLMFCFSSYCGSGCSVIAVVSVGVSVGVGVRVHVAADSALLRLVR